MLTNSANNKVLELVKDAFDYSKKNGRFSSLTVKGFVENDNHNFAAASFVFYVNDNKECISKITYTDNDFTKLPEKIENVSTKEFINFYQKIASQAKTKLIERSDDVSKELTSSSVDFSLDEKDNSPTFDFIISPNDINNLDNNMQCFVEEYITQSKEISTDTSEIVNKIRNDDFYLER